MPVVESDVLPSGSVLSRDSDFSRLPARTELGIVELFFAAFWHKWPWMEP